MYELDFYNLTKNDCDNYEGGTFSYYKDRYSYVHDHGFEKDLMRDWVDSCSNSPTVLEMADMFYSISKVVKEWLDEK